MLKITWVGVAWLETQSCGHGSPRRTVKTVESWDRWLCFWVSLICICGLYLTPFIKHAFWDLKNPKKNTSLYVTVSFLISNPIYLWKTVQFFCVRTPFYMLRSAVSDTREQCSLLLFVALFCNFAILYERQEDSLLWYCLYHVTWVTYDWLKFGVLDLFILNYFSCWWLFYDYVMNVILIWVLLRILGVIWSFFYLIFYDLCYDHPTHQLVTPTWSCIGSRLWLPWRGRRGKNRRCFTFFQWFCKEW
jgi:hypothetical protein